MTMQKTALLISLLMMAGMASAASPDVSRASQTPGDTFYFLDRFSDSLELAVAKAPILGSSELEAKVRANQAAERLAEAQKLAEKNKSGKVDKLMAEYNRQINLSVRSAKKTNKTGLSERLKNVSNNHVKTLQEAERKVPEPAKKGIQNAIENSQRNQKELELPNVAEERRTEMNTGINKGEPGNRSPESELTSEPGKKANRTLDGFQKEVENWSDQEMNETVAEEAEEDGEIEEVVENTTAGENLTGSEQETIENGSKITGEAVGKPSINGIP